MKVYQVVKVSRSRADRDGQAFYFNNRQDASTVFEVVLNQYAGNGWTLNGFSAVGDGYNETIYAVFEKGS